MDHGAGRTMVKQALRESLADKVASRASEIARRLSEQQPKVGELLNEKKQVNTRAR